MALAQRLDDELLLVRERCPCREQQILQLSALLSPTFPGPPTLVIYGSRATGKSTIVASYLKTKNFRHAIVHCRGYVTGRQLLERTVDAVQEELQSYGSAEQIAEYGARCESLSAFAVHLQRLLEHRERFVLVLDGVDKQRDAPATLLPALARLSEFIPNITIVLIVRHPSSPVLHRTGVPHIRFTPYTRNQSIHILSRDPPDIFLEPPPSDSSYDEGRHEEDKAWLWPRFCAAVWDALAQNAARDLVSFRDVCHKLWRPFVAPIISGDFGTRDFSRLLVTQRRLFQDESILLDSIVSQPSTAIFQHVKGYGHDLPYYTKWLIIAAYLASYNPARMDVLYFMKYTERKRRKKGGGTARSGTGRPTQNRKIPRHLLPPSAFTLDRLLAILHAILPHKLKTTIDIYTQIATLTSLRLLVRGGGISGSDPLEPGCRWKVGPQVSWEFVLGLARSVDFDLVDYIIE